MSKRRADDDGQPSDHPIPPPNLRASASATSSASPTPIHLSLQPHINVNSDIATAGSPTPSAAPTRSTPAQIGVRPSRSQPDFSGQVRQRLSQYTRTGQACDRCKVRKIRCDGDEDGCSNCHASNEECRVTDRVSNRTYRRGYTKELEQQKESLFAHIASLEKLLAQQGVEVKPWTWDNVRNQDIVPPAHMVNDQGAVVPDPEYKGWTRDENVWVRRKLDASTPTPPAGRPAAGRPFVLGSDLEPRVYDAHIGVRSDSEPLSSVKGTLLSIMGTTVNVTDMSGPDVDEPDSTIKDQPLYNKSSQALLQTICRVNPVVKPQLPDHDAAANYSAWYFLLIHGFEPVIHRPTYDALLEHLKSGYQPTAAEEVQLHMVHAIIFFHIGVRNWENAEHRKSFTDLSNAHYHYALSRYYDLKSNPSLESAQALTLMAGHARAFPKPGACLELIQAAFSMAIELNLHRAVRMPPNGTNLNIEMRKRVWWGILAIYVTICGRLGRPMPISPTEFDVNFPEPIPEEALSLDGVDMTKAQGPCHYRVAVMAYKIIALSLEMYLHIHAVRIDPSTYVDVVNRLEEKCQEWFDSVPDDFILGNAGKDTQLPAIYTRLWSLEFRLQLRHPGVCTSKDPKMIAENRRIVLEVSKEILNLANLLSKLKALDTTWYNVALYVGCIFSTLSAHWEMRFQATQEEIDDLQKDMNNWISILYETSQTMAIGDRIVGEVRKIVEQQLKQIVTDRTSKHEALAPHMPTQPYSQPQQQHPPPEPQANSGNYYASQAQGMPIQQHIYAQNGVQGDATVMYPRPQHQGLGADNAQNMIWQQQEANSWHTWTTSLGNTQNIQTAMSMTNDPSLASQQMPTALSSLPVTQSSNTWPQLVFNTEIEASQQPVYNGTSSHQPVYNATSSQQPYTGTHTPSGQYSSTSTPAHQVQHQGGVVYAGTP